MPQMVSDDKCMYFMNSVNLDHADDFTYSLLILVGDGDHCLCLDSNRFGQVGIAASFSISSSMDL